MIVLLPIAGLLGALPLDAPQARQRWPEDIVDRLIAHPPPTITPRRLPPGFRIGRCLLVVEGRTRISGKCAYRIDKGGDFHIDGPHQVFDGIDYPKADIMAAMISTDYWANVFRQDGGWTGHGNSNVGSVHGDGDWGSLTRQGACWRGAHVRICLWRK